MVVQGESIITYPYNNVSISYRRSSLSFWSILFLTTHHSYGVHVFNQSLHEELLHNWTRPDGCKEQLLACQDALEGHGLLFFERGTNALGDACERLSPECAATHAFEIYQDGVEPGAGEWPQSP